MRYGIIFSLAVLISLPVQAASEQDKSYSGFGTAFSQQGHAGFSDPIIEDNYLVDAEDEVPMDVLNNILSVEPAAGEPAADMQDMQEAISEDLQ